MKTKTLLLSLLFFSLLSSAQSVAKVLTKKPVKSIQWGSRPVQYVDGFWEMITPQLAKKFTKKLVDSIETYSMSMYYANSLDNEEMRAKIKAYHVATFDNNFGGSFHGVWYILMVPYEENKEQWRYNQTRPNDFFIPFPKSAIELEE